MNGSTEWRLSSIVRKQFGENCAILAALSVIIRGDGMNTKESLRKELGKRDKCMNTGPIGVCCQWERCSEKGRDL